MCNGKFGYYIKHNKKNYSLLEEHLENIERFTLSNAIDIIKNNKKNNKIIKFEKKDIEIKIGKYGPYFNYNKKNYSIPKNYDLNKLDVDDIKKIVNYKKKIKK